MAKAGTLFMVGLTLLLVFTLTCAARPAKDISPVTTPQLKDVEGEGKNEDEWLMRKTFDEAHLHLDYIYTQEQPHSDRHYP